MSLNFFAAVKQTQFASELFAAAGFDFEAALKGNDKNALKSHVDSAVKAQIDAAVAAAGAEQAELIENLTESLDEAVKESAAQAEQLATAKADADKLAALSASITSAGLKVEDIKGSVDAAVTKAACAELAKAGHPGVVEQVATEPTKPAKVEAPKLTGRAAVEAFIATGIAHLQRK